MSTSFTEADLRQMQAKGIETDEALRQLELLRRSSLHVRLIRPCSVGDGIRQIKEAEAESYLAAHARASDAGRFLKFVPASGAATRMFKSLQRFLQDAGTGKNPPLEGEVRDFFDNLPRFAFYPYLVKALKRKGWDLEAVRGQEASLPILEALLTSEGLDYARLPKALLAFHRYGQESRTPLEEHLVEAALIVKDARRLCHLHLTVQTDHEDAFQRLLKERAPHYEEYFGVHYEVEFSHQKPSTDTIAGDPAGGPFRDEHDRLLFRPGGHGALLENLNDRKGDLIYVKNIDNVVPDHLKETSTYWKRVLGGYLVEFQAETHRLVQALAEASGEGRGVIEEAVAFARERLQIDLPDGDLEGPVEDVRRRLRERLDRPMRVCGMVRNEGEPGGGPFWTMDEKGGLSRQIVEKAQIDIAAPEQKKIWESATHFNPVDLVCGVRNAYGEPHDLSRFVDPNAVFISRKSHHGRELLALELPGLWNGAMAHWISLFVEVPIITFNPVKTVMDLLRPEHQPENESK